MAITTSSSRPVPSSFLLPLLIATLALFTSLCDAQTSAKDMSRGDPMFTLETDAFSGGEEIPPKYTCSCSDVSPALRWTGPPGGTKSFALLVDDPDAPSGTFTHWVAYGIPAETMDMPEGVAKTEKLPNGTMQGVNGFRKIGYGGPCPPPGKPHRYFFKLFALDTPLNLKSGATKQEVEQAIKGHILGEAQLMGTFKR